jgi:type 2 lantibiotic biosynthesis protein LanM
VLRTGLLPYWECETEGSKYDLSGLGIVNEQQIPFRIQKWENVNNDLMKLSYEYFKAEPSEQVSSLEDKSSWPINYIVEIEDGFRQMYCFLINQKKVLLASDSPLKILKDQEVRFVFRSTKIYRSILLKTLNPKYLRDGIDRSIEFDVLCRGFLSSPSKPLLWPLLEVERQALEQMDIPKFKANSSSSNLTLGNDIFIKNCFIKSSYEFVIHNLQQLSVKILEQQLYFIREAFNCRFSSEKQILSLEEDFNLLNDEPEYSFEYDEIIKLATEIGAELHKKAIYHTDGSVNWIAPRYNSTIQGFQLQPLDYDLYEGSFGIALFLAALEKVTADSKYHQLMLGALQPFCKKLKQDDCKDLVDQLGIGGACGLGSIIYVLVRISQFLKKPIFLEDAIKTASLITPDDIISDNKFDIISGSAGLILGLLSLYSASNNSSVLEQAITCGVHLLNNRTLSKFGYRAWETYENKLLNGFAHGAAGIAYALLCLYQVSKNNSFLEAAQEAIAYEKSIFISDIGNWPDLREPSINKNVSCMCSWCHGATGIGLARVASLNILDSSEIRQDIYAAIKTTKQYDFSAMDNLCCGNLGRVEFLFTASQKLSNFQLQEIAIKQLTQVIRAANRRGTFNYHPSLSYIPGFFQGAAGIGYELLRLAHPDILPSVLLWE